MDNTQSKISDQTIYIMVWLPWSWKSTWVKNQFAEDKFKLWTKVISRDNIRDKMWFERPTTREQEEDVSERRRTLLTEYCEDWYDVVIDDCNVKRQNHELIQEVITRALPNNVFRYKLVWMQPHDLDNKMYLDMCKKRNKLRADEWWRFVPEQIIDDMFIWYIQLKNLLIKSIK